MASGYTHQEVRAVPPGWKVRTVKAREHRVRVAFPPGRREKGSGVVVAVLHPKNENPNTCTTRQKNPAELLLMGANPIDRGKAKEARERATRIRAARLSNPYDALSVNERLAFGRLGLGKAQLQSEADIRKARKQVRHNERFRNRLPNPGGLPGVDSTNAHEAIALSEEFHDDDVKYFRRATEPHMPDGNYTELGDFFDINVKPGPNAPQRYVLTITFEGADVLVVCDPSGRQLYLAGDGQSLDEPLLEMFGAGREEPCFLGHARDISYWATKWHPQVPDNARGKDSPYVHRFGDEGGTQPEIFWSRSMKRLLIGKASYRVEGAGIAN